jgi:hypothetical protein
MLALIAGTVSYLHMHLLVELHGQPGWVAALTPLSVDGMIVAASTTLLARFSVGTQRWSIAVGTSGREQRRQPGGQYGRGRAKPDRARDRSVAVVRADRLR